MSVQKFYRPIDVPALTVAGEAAGGGAAAPLALTIEGDAEWSNWPDAGVDGDLALPAHLTATYDDGTGYLEAVRLTSNGLAGISRDSAEAPWQLGGLRLTGSYVTVQATVGLALQGPDNSKVRFDSDGATLQAPDTGEGRHVLEGVAGVRVPIGTTEQRPPLAVGVLRLNTSLDLRLEFGAWDAAASAAAWLPVALLRSGTSAERPSIAPPGTQYFDTTLNKPIWVNAAADGWVDAAGAAVPAANL